jgi:hypothetical protein
MLPILRQLIILVFVILGGASARGQGLVQLSLDGSIAPRGGAIVEVLWETQVAGREASVVNLRVHLAQGTSAYDVGRLLAAQLKAKSIGGVYPGDVAPAEGATHLFVAQTSVLRLRLPPGLTSKVTSCDAAPTRIRILRADAYPGKTAGKIAIRTSTMHPHTRKTGSVLLETEIKADEAPDSICEALFVSGLEKNLVVDRPTQDSWRPIRGDAGMVVVGCSIEMITPNADWGLELRMGSPLR